MSSESALGELERQFSRLPAETYKHDPAIADELMATWISELPLARRREVLRALVAWLRDHDHPWHDDAALEIAARLHDEQLIDAAIAEGERLGTNHEVAAPNGPMAPWLKFQLHLIASIFATPTPAGRAYLRALRDRCLMALTDAERELCLRAWITECAIAKGPGEWSCLSKVVKQIRQWNDRRVARSAFGLLGSYYRNDVELMRGMLTADELKLALP